MPDTTNNRRLAGSLFVGIATILLCMPFFFSVDMRGDEGVIAHGGLMLLRGQQIYRDFFEFLPPGGFLITQGWMALCGTSFVAMRLLVLAIALGIVELGFLICVELADSVAIATVLALAFLVTADGVLVQLSHHWLTTLLSLLAAWGVLGDRGRQIDGAVVAGLAAGSAAMVTPSCGLLVGLAALVAVCHGPSMLRRLIGFAFGGAALPLVVLVYLIVHGEVGASFDDVVRYTLGHYEAIQGIAYASGTPWYNEAKYIFPLAALLGLGAVAIDPRFCLNDLRFRDAAGFAVAGALGFLPRPDIGHIIYATPLALPFVSLALSRIALYLRLGNRVATLFALFYLPAVLLYPLVAGAALEAPRIVGAIRQSPGDHDNWAAMLHLIQATPAGDPYLFYPYLPIAPYLTGHPQATKFDLFTPGYSTPQVYAEACRETLAVARWAVLDHSWMDPAQLRARFPALHDPSPFETQSFERAIRANFDQVAQTGNLSLWRRNARENTADCAAIAGAIATGTKPS